MAQQLRAAWGEAIPVQWPALEGLSHAHGYALLIARAAQGLLNARRGWIRDAGAMATGGRDARLWLGYHEPELSTGGLSLVGRWLFTLARCEGLPKAGTLAPLEAETEEFLKQLRREHPDYIARILMIGADSAGIPVLASPLRKRAWQFGWGARALTLFETNSLTNSGLALATARDKSLTAHRLAALGLPHTAPRLANTLEDAEAHRIALGGPVVVKPVDGGKGRGVTVGITSAATLAEAFDSAMAQSSSRRVLLERVVEGHDHRLLVVRGQVAVVTRRDPPAVTGDGQSSLRSLVAALNASRQDRGPKARYLKTVKFDAAVTSFLANQGLTPESVPAAGRRVLLRGNANVSTGGTPTDMTSLVHPQVRQIAERIADDLGLMAVGLDYITPDIARPWHEVGGAFIEVNSTPGLDLHVASGVDEAAMGVCILGTDLGCVPAVLVVVTEQRWSEWQDALTREATHWPRGTGCASAGRCSIDGLTLALPTQLHLAVPSLLRMRSLNALVVLALATEIAGKGLPLPRVGLAVLDLPDDDERDPLRELIADHADRIHEVQGVRDLRAALDAVACGLKAAPPTLLPLRQSPPAPAGISARRHRAGEVELDVLRAHDFGPGPVVVCIVRNARYLAPHFLAHHRKLGFVGFVFFDDQSDDGTREFLSQQPDALVLGSALRYRQRMDNGKPLHQNLRNWLPASLPGQRWVAVLDIDEFLILPSRLGTITDLARWLDERGHVSVLASMVDFYPRTLEERLLPAPASPFEVSRYFDIHKGFERRRGPGPTFRKTPGGVRWRLQEWLRQEYPGEHARIFKGRGYLRGSSWKHPLIRTGTDTWLINSHSINGLAAPGLELVLAHFKFSPDLDDGLRVAIASNSYYLRSIECHFLRAVLERFAQRDLTCEASRVFESADSLADAGLLVLEDVASSGPGPGRV